jgi:hypothetical protein
VNSSEYIKAVFVIFTSGYLSSSDSLCEIGGEGLPGGGSPSLEGNLNFFLSRLPQKGGHINMIFV